jgi:O-antigen/teichoic acid export membrane protein
LSEPADSPGPVRDGHADAKQRSVRAVKWSALAELCGRSVQPLMLLILARLLSPEEFGVVGVATIVIGLAQIFQEFGVGRALVQTRDDVAIFANNAFWTNLTCGTVLYAGLFFGAEGIVRFFQSASSAGVLRVLGLQIILMSLISVQSAMLQRDIRFKALFFVRFLPTLVTGVLSVALAWLGHGVWAIVWGTLGGAAIQVGLYWGVSPWRPQLGFEWAGFQRMFIFSRWVLLEAALAWLVSWGDAIALGHFLGPETLGQYRVGCVVVAFLSNILFTPLVPVAFGLLSRLQDDREAFTNSLGKLTRMVVLISLPLATGAAFLGQPVTVTVLGPQWAGAGLVVQLMGLRMGLEWLVGLNSTAFTAIGRPDMNVKLLVLAVAITLPVYLWAGPLGLVVFCWARLGASQLNNVASYPFARRVLALPERFLWDRVRAPLAACIVMAGVLALAVWQLPENDPAVVGMLIVAGAVVYAGALWWFDRAVLPWAWGAVRQMFAREGAVISPS